MSKAPIRRTQDLPAADHTAFRQLVNLNDSKQYKKGLKAADALLKKHPEHADTMAIKALCMNRMNTVAGKAAALPLARQAIKFDMKSRLCWHVVGLICRHDRDYSEAVKSLKMAVRFEDDNVPLWRELAGAQSQEESWDGLLESRLKILSLRNDQDFNFHGASTAHFMCGHYNEAALLAEHTLHQFYLKQEEEDKKVVEAAREKGLETDSELKKLAAVKDWDKIVGKMDTILFIALCLEKQGKYMDALSFLLKHEAHFTHPVSFYEKVSHLALYAREYQTAEKYYSLTLNRLGENQNAFFGLLFSKLQTTASAEVLSELSKIGFGPVAAPNAPACEQSPSVLLVCPSHHPYASGIKGWNHSPLFSKFPSFITESASAQLVKRGWKFVDQSFDGGRVWALSLFNSQASDATRDALLSTIASIKDAHPKSGAVVRANLLFRNEKTGLREAVETFLTSMLRKGVPSFPLISLLRGIIEATSGHQILASLLRELSSRIQRPCRSFKAEATEGEPEETPDVEVGTIALLACLEDYLGNSTSAISLIETAIQKAPTHIDLYNIKGRIAKHAGANRLAAQLHEESRSMDLADKHLNTRAVKYWLREGVEEVDIAHKLVHLFPGEVGKTPNLHDTQVMWWERKMGSALIRTGLEGITDEEKRKNIGRGLRHLMHSMDHFEDFKDNAHDFHPYTLRNGQIANYVDFLSAVSKVKSHKQFTRPACLLIDTLLKIHTGEVSNYGPALKAEIEAAAAKKAKKDQKKKPAASADDDEEVVPKRVDTDPEGLEILTASSILDLAVTIAESIRQKCVLDAPANIAASYVWILAAKPLLAIQALVRAKQVLGSTSHYKLIPAVVNFLNNADISTLPAEVAAASIKTISTQLIPTTADISLSSAADFKSTAAKLASATFSLVSSSPITAAAPSALQLLAIVGAIHSAQIVKTTQLDSDTIKAIETGPQSGVSVQIVTETLSVLKNTKLVSAETLKAFAEEGLKAFPFSDELRKVVSRDIECLAGPDSTAAVRK